MFRHRDEQTVRELGFDPPHFPPRQKITEKWPALPARDLPGLDLESWTFPRVRRGSAPRRVDLRAAAGSPGSRGDDRHPLRRSGSRFDTRFQSVRQSELAPIVEQRPAAQFAIAQAEQRYTTNVPLSARTIQERWRRGEPGEPVTSDHGSPLCLIMPSREAWKSSKWLRIFELTAVDHAGFWERVATTTPAPGRESATASSGLSRKWGAAPGGRKPGWQGRRERRLGRHIGVTEDAGGDPDVGWVVGMLLLRRFAAVIGSRLTFRTGP